MTLVYVNEKPVYVLLKTYFTNCLIFQYKSVVKNARLQYVVPSNHIFNGSDKEEWHKGNIK